MNLDNIRRAMLMVMGALVLLILLVALFGGGKKQPEPPADPLVAVADTPTAPPEAKPSPADTPQATTTPAPAAPHPQDDTPAEAPKRINGLPADFLAIINSHDTLRHLNPYHQHFDSMPPGGVKMKINWVGGYLARVFNDSNYLHISAAQAIGITPVSDLRTAWQAGARMERLASCREYYLDDLSHSLPYLVPQAHSLLKEIGHNFRDSLAARGGGDYRIKITSVLRTPSLVKKLRRRNRNAVDTSAHLFGTTFDISYAKFICDSVTVPRTQEDLKNLLAEVVYDLRDRGRCYVKYERKQACFHITAR